jgi:chromosome segregation ATPase
MLAIATIVWSRPEAGEAAPLVRVVTAETSQPAPSQNEPALRLQIDQANALLQVRQATYQGQIQELRRRIEGGQVQLDYLAQRETALQQQLGQLQTARATRLDSYAGQLTAAQVAYQARFDQLRTQLQGAQTRLAEANAILGR